MKRSLILLAAALLLTIASAGSVRAAETAGAPSPELVPAAQGVPTLSLGDATLSTPAESCQADATRLITTGGPDVTETSTQTCGSCSTSNCVGALRGQFCNTGSGLGHCNIFSGGFMCPTGGWECQCESGALP